ncbi:hypothetical protein SAMN05428642_103191 [Flaviramulus basaltis]|uniref:Uncharacterized protein n=1 Tax=Flaviramulus basaltis TaxID=369401 RepID=A0A1K2IMQ8_9FLAO|nr:hypothetical protein [Flaviramulus basaltis]SFZ93538.1 hypothetical protein SAMN05428642_103191 [Flaviramulus basaltis]
MYNNIRKINHRGEEYISLTDVLELVKRCNDLTHFDIMVNGESYDFKNYKTDLDLEKKEPPFLKVF